ncbi:hypothetical protein [Nocardia sp. NPDC059239]|uniref:hypothetical protein n=1 Tax=Nocardia sp. NPDC059239 TaxID=3346785 RepID=UPI00367F3B11
MQIPRNPHRQPSLPDATDSRQGQQSGDRQQALDFGQFDAAAHEAVDIGGETADLRGHSATSTFFVLEVIPVTLLTLCQFFKSYTARPARFDQRMPPSSRRVAPVQ